MTAIIDASHLFKSLDAEGRRDVLKSGYVMSYEADDIVVLQGDPGDTMFLVIRGKVRVETEKPGGKMLQLAELGPGACVGEVSVLSGTPRTATVRAISDVDVVALARHRVVRVLAQYPKVRELLESIIQARAEDTIEKIIG